MLTEFVKIKEEFLNNCLKTTQTTKSNLQSKNINHTALKFKQTRESIMLNREISRNLFFKWLDIMVRNQQPNQLTAEQALVQDHVCSLQQILMHLQREIKQLFIESDATFSVIGITDQLIEFIKAEPTSKKMIVQHSNSKNQLLMLALCVAAETKEPIIIYTSKKGLIYKAMQNDKSTLKESIGLRYYQQYTQQKPTENKLIFVDCFLIDESVYGPTLSNLSSTNTIIIYTEDQRKLNEEALCLQLSCNFPIEVILNCNAKDEIVNIIKESTLYAEKVDIVIFSTSFEIIKPLLHNLDQNKLPYNLIQNAADTCDNNNSNIILCKSAHQFAHLDFNLNKVIAVFDFGFEMHLYFDPVVRCVIDQTSQASIIETRGRMNVLGLAKPGKYFKMYEHRSLQMINFSMENLIHYVLKSISLRISKEKILQSHTQSIKSRIQCTINLLVSQKVLEEKEGQLYILPSKEVIDTNSILNLHFSSILTSQKSNSNLSNVLVYAFSFLFTQGFLNGSQTKFDGIWRKNGELSSYVQILYLYETIIQRIKRGIKTVEVSSFDASYQQYQMFGMLYQEVQPRKKLTVSEMDADQFLVEYGINKKYIEQCLQMVTKIRELFEIPYVEISNIDQEIENAIFTLFGQFHQVGYYTGSRRIGYCLAKSAKNYLPSKDSLLGLLNQRPSIVLPLKITKNKEQYQLLMANKVTEEMFISFDTDITLVNQKSSFGETEVQFHGIPNALFDTLWKQEGKVIAQFEKKFECIVEQNPEVGSVVIFCARTNKDAIGKEFEQMIAISKKDLLNQTKILEHHNLKLVLQKGGKLREILNQNDEREICLVNLHPDVTERELLDLLDQYVDVEKFELTTNHRIKDTKKALIKFMTKDDMFYILNELNYTQFKGRKIRFEKNENAADNKLIPQNCVKFKWYVWKSAKSCRIVFKEKQEVEKAFNSFQTNNLLDGKRVSVCQQECTLIISNLSETTDQIYLERALKIYGTILQIHIDKKSLNEKSVDSLIEYYIRESTTKQERFHILSIKKKAQGLRVAKIRIHNPESVNVLCEKLNQKMGLIGQTRLYVMPYYSEPYLVVKSLDHIYTAFIAQYLEKNQDIANKIKIKRKIKQNLHYLIVRSQNKTALDIFKVALNERLKPSALGLTPQQQKVILCEMGLKGLHKIESKYTCKFFPNILKKELSVICRQKDYIDIYAEVKALPNEVTVLNIVMSLKTFRLLMKREDILIEVEKKNNLKSIKLDKIGKCVLIQGVASQLQKAKNNLSFIIHSLTNNHQNIESSEACGICCEELSHPYRLQVCSHAFCLQCLMFSINNSFVDVSTFPIRCPHCLEQLVLQDLKNLLDATAWVKLQSIATNDFVNRNSDKYMYCYTPNCTGIHNPKDSWFSCSICQHSFCTTCKNDKHPGLTCQEAKQGNQGLLKKYMEQNDVRICPNTSCKMLMQRVDGCYRVTCSRCQQSMCWKCPRDAMPVYKTADQCYRHLTQKHGGYW